MLIKLFIPFQMSDASLELPQEKKIFQKSGHVLLETNV